VGLRAWLDAVAPARNGTPLVQPVAYADRATTALKSLYVLQLNLVLGVLNWKLCEFNFVQLCVI